MRWMETKMRRKAQRKTKNGKRSRSRSQGKMDRARWRTRNASHVTEVRPPFTEDAGKTMREGHTRDEADL